VIPKGGKRNRNIKISRTELKGTVKEKIATALIWIQADSTSQQQIALDW